MNKAELEQEIARLTALKNTPYAPSSLPSDDLRETIRQILREELTPMVSPVAEKIPLMAAVGSGLTEEQQLWLSQNLDSLSDFFLMAEGQAITKRFFTLYKDFVCKSSTQ